MNDNAPFFSERVYTARVPENTDIGTIVMTVTAEDLDERTYVPRLNSLVVEITYFLSRGTLNSAFSGQRDLMSDCDLWSGSEFTVGQLLSGRIIYVSVWKAIGLT